MHVSARTLDFALEVGSQVRVVPRGQSWTAMATHTIVEPLAWTNSLGFVALDGFGFPDLFADGLNEAGLSVGTLWLAETSLPADAPATGSAPAAGFVDLAGWLLGTCSTVAEVRAALATVQVWGPKVRDMWPTGTPCRKACRPWPTSRSRSTSPCTTRTAATWSSSSRPTACTSTTTPSAC
jgi:penicillin V acylase-like amidase (Ntn superfamily)